MQLDNLQRPRSARIAARKRVSTAGVGKNPGADPVFRVRTQRRMHFAHTTAAKIIHHGCF
jgi:hypothetical protein